MIAELLALVAVLILEGFTPEFRRSLLLHRHRTTDGMCSGELRHSVLRRYLAVGRDDEAVAREREASFRAYELNRSTHGLTTAGLAMRPRCRKVAEIEQGVLRVRCLAVVL